MKNERFIQRFTVVLIGLSLCVATAIAGPLELKHKLRSGEQIHEKTTLVSKVMSPDKSKTVSLTINYPTMTYVAKAESGEISSHRMLQSELIAAERNGQDIREEFRAEIDGFFLNDSDDLPVALIRPFDAIGSLPESPVRIGDEWTQSIDDPAIGQLTTTMRSVRIETIDGHESAIIEGTIAGYIRSPDNAIMPINKGEYKMAFAIEEGIIIRKEIMVDLPAVLPKDKDSQERNSPEEENNRSPERGNRRPTENEMSERPQSQVSVQTTYTSELISRETLAADAIEALETALGLIEAGEKSLTDGNTQAATSAFEQVLAVHPDENSTLTHLQHAVKQLMAKGETFQGAADSSAGLAPPSNVEEAVRLGDATKSGIIITWQPSPSQSVVNYEVLRGASENDATKIGEVSTNENLEYIDTSPADGSLYFVQAVNNDGNRAVASLEFPSDMGGLFGRLQQYGGQGELGKLLAFTQRLMQRNLPGFMMEFVGEQVLGAFKRHGRIDELAAVYEKIAEANPDDARSQQILAYIYLQGEQGDKAVAIFQKALSHAPNDARLHENLAQAYQIQGDAENAIASIKKAMELDKEDPLAKNESLAKIYAHFGMKDEVKALAEGLLKQASADPWMPSAYFAYLAGAAYNAGEFYEEGAAIFKKNVFDMYDTPSEGYIPYSMQGFLEATEKGGNKEAADFIRQAMMPSSERGEGRNRFGRPPSTKVGDGQVPDMPLKTLSGKEIKLSDFPDKLILLSVFTTKLPESMAGLKTLEALHQANQKSVAVLGMTVDEDAETVKKAIEGVNITYPIILAERTVHEVCEFAIAKPINVFPTTLTIIGNGGLMHEKHEGALSETQLRDAIESTKQHRKSLDLEPNILWAERVLEVSSEYSESDWSAKQILGAPDTYPNHGDLPTAWASQSEDEAAERIKVGFERPARMTGIKIYETYNPGALERVEAIDEMGGVHAVWEGKAEPITQKRRILRVDISPTDYKVTEIVLKLNPQKVPGWNQIDAVGLVYVEE